MSNDPSHRWALEGDPEVKARNRYSNVQAWANSRIHLKVPEGECDFINASPIILKDSVTQGERRYIATQVSTVDDQTSQQFLTVAGPKDWTPRPLLAHGIP